MFAWIEGAFDLIINYSIILLEFIGSAIIVVTAIKALMSFVPAAGALLGALCLAFYPLTTERMDKVQKSLLEIRERQ